MYVTYCSKDKNPSTEDLPALDRYQWKDGRKWKDGRISKVYERALKDEVEFRILSGSPDYHLLKVDDSTKYYDHQLKDHEVEEKVKNVGAQLEGQNIGEIVFFMKDPNNAETRPYKNVMEKVCKISKVKFVVRLYDTGFLD